MSEATREERKAAFIAADVDRLLSTRAESAFSKYAPLMKLEEFYMLIDDVQRFVLAERKRAMILADKRLAKVAYNAALDFYAADNGEDYRPSGEHTFENQSENVQEQWIAVVTAVREAMK